MKVNGRYDRVVLNVIDCLCYGLTYPFLFSISGLFSAGYDVPHLRDKPIVNRIQRGLWGLAFLAGALLTLPLYMMGQLYWTLLCELCQHRDYIQIETQDETQASGSSDDFAFLSSNMLLGYDALGTFQNMKHVSERHGEFRTRYSKFGAKHLRNLQDLEQFGHKKDAILADFSNFDFILFQEVWDRFYAGSMIQTLKKSGFHHFIIDVGRQSLSNNFCTGCSGLMLASKYPITRAEFLPYGNKKSWQRFISYGALFVKVDLSKGTGGDKNEVGYIANLHTMAFQGKENQIEKALTLTKDSFQAFREENAVPNENVLFATMGGDFNSDNLSPGDQDTQNHPLYKEFMDVGAKSPGLDHDWTIGTEWRQLKIHDQEVATSEKVKSVFVDDVLRRYYVLDADVEEQTLELMVCDPKPDSQGQIKAEPFGGKRRIDKILYDPRYPTRPTGYAFYSTLAGLTDHIPVALTLSRSK
eukprot:maker-scaffold137_size321222-snap-gene-0.11 protein:Tk01554 transcript:maker-scaffold137_size321222-snap-gene-0.11-mRNA-1 annotation:"hypothetical protein DAPPUDRAFT_322081"